ncbi:MAG: pyridoxal 5'-phosphate synthase glutaminase subunit PdxT [Acidobacteria bacterium]|nr:pyridoxal 5'-phosphate synthase glutaminase subunit PdxT [Acidobacteriota bacterium]
MGSIHEPTTGRAAPAPPPRIGVLALQGSFALHAAALRRLGIEAVEVRRAPALEGLDGLIIPGGESSTMLKFLLEEDLFDPLIAFHRDGGAFYGTCAGAILLARTVENPAQESLGLLDVEIQRNGYGRQLESHVGACSCSALGEPDLSLVMIRGPVISSAGPGVEVLAKWRGAPAFVREGRVLATTFHPELTDDTRIHAYFLEVATEARQATGATLGGTNSR